MGYTRKDLFWDNRKKKSIEGVPLSFRHGQIIWDDTILETADLMPLLVVSYSHLGKTFMFASQNNSGQKVQKVLNLLQYCQWDDVIILSTVTGGLQA